MERAKRQVEKQKELAELAKADDLKQAELEKEASNNAM